MKIAIDGSSIMWTALLAGRDAENGQKIIFEDRETLINSAEYGFENAISMVTKALEDYKLVPINVIWVFEGENSKAKRRLIDPLYKEKDSRPPEAYEQFNLLKEMLRTTWLELGAQVMVQDFAEGDDTLAWLAKHTEEDLVIFTRDNDLCALNTDANEYGAKVETCINHMKAFNKYGLFDFHLITTYKALVGDTSDSIKGCKGFGAAAFEKFVNQYGFDGLQELHDMLLSSSLDPIALMAEDPEHKILKKIVEQEADVIKSFDVARLRPEWVNTMKFPLKMEAGMVRQLRPGDDPRLKKWYGRIRLVTADNFEEAKAWARPLIAASEEVALDIETSSADESDDWLARQGSEDGVDVFGSSLTGLSLTFGRNNQFTLYFSVDHANTDNIASEDLRLFIDEIDKPLIIQNVSFELAVLYNEWGQKQLDNGYHGFLRDVLDTKFESNYVNENRKTGLKENSLHYLGYKQQSYDETTKLSGYVGELPDGGKFLSETEAVWETIAVGTGKFHIEQKLDDMDQPYEVKTEITRIEDLLDDHGGKILKTGPIQTRRYKMNELSAEHVTYYGADDTICTMALHNHFKLRMQLEHHYDVYLDVEIDAAYLHALSFIQGCEISVEKINQLAAEDTITYDRSWVTVRDYLMTVGWEGTVCPKYVPEMTYTDAQGTALEQPKLANPITPAEIKAAYKIVFDRDLDTQMRTLSKLVTFIRNVPEGDGEVFASLLERLIAGEPREFNDYVESFFNGEPKFNDGSPKQMAHLLYEVMGLPVRVRNKPTETMKKAGIREGSPKTDSLAIAYALQECDLEQKGVLEALKLMAMVGTRRSLYYTKYPSFKHWKDGRVRSQHNQTSTNTRRASESKPNKQQMPKHAKIEGQDAKFRECVVPHKPKAVIVSMDFEGQEMVIIAARSRDQMLMSCYVGENKRKMHIITGLGIMKLEPQSLKSLGITKSDDREWTYDYMASARKDEKHIDYVAADKGYQLGKKVNFTTEFGAMAPKLAETMMVSVELAQEFIDAREAMFPRVAEWKLEEQAKAKECGEVRTMMGAVRHLRDALVEGDSWTKSKAERQAVNFEVQSSAAEQTKKAEGRMWKDGLFVDFDATYIGPIHDETVASVLIKDLMEFIPRMHACMVAPYADMDIKPVSSISFGWDFYNQIEIGSEPTPEAIAKGIEKLMETA